MASQASKYQLKNKLQRQLSVDTNPNPGPEDVIVLKPLGFDLSMLTEEQAAYVKANYGSNVIIQKVNY